MKGRKYLCSKKHCCPVVWSKMSVVLVLFLTAWCSDSDSNEEIVMHITFNQSTQCCSSSLAFKLHCAACLLQPQNKSRLIILTETPACSSLLRPMIISCAHYFKLHQEVLTVSNFSIWQNEDEKSYFPKNLIFLEKQNKIKAKKTLTVWMMKMGHPLQGQGLHSMQWIRGLLNAAKLKVFSIKKNVRLSV